MARAPRPWAGYEVCEPRLADDDTLIPAVPQVSLVTLSTATFADMKRRATECERPPPPRKGRIHWHELAHPSGSDVSFRRHPKQVPQS